MPVGRRLGEEVARLVTGKRIVKVTEEQERVTRTRT